MSDLASTLGTRSVADWLAMPVEDRVELIDGALVQKAAPSFEHGLAQAQIAMELGRAFGRRTAPPASPAGWWIVTEVDISFDGHGYRPDLAGWRHVTLPAPPQGRPVTVRPDWICEVVSESNRRVDTVVKLNRYQQGGVPHYWIVDQFERTLTVYRHTVEGYLVALRADEQQVVCAEPFDSIELSVATLLGAQP